MRVYYGWVIVGISLVLLLFAIGTTVYAFGLFILPVSQDFGLSRANMNTGLILLNVGMAVLSPIVGRLLDRVPVRLVLGLSGAALAAGFLVLGLSHSVWLSATMLAGPVALGVVGVGTLTTTTLIARWFASGRARAMAIAAVGISLGSVVAVPPIGLLIEAVGWRQTLMVEALAIGAVVMLVLPFVRARPPLPESVGVPDLSARPAPEQSAVRPLTTGELLKSPVFWTISLSLGLGFGVLQTIVVSLIPYAQESGLPIAQAASLVSVYGGMAILGKLVLAGIGDRVDRVVLLTVLFAVVAVTSAAPLLSQTYLALLACSAILGTAAGATTPAFTALLADRFGAASIGTAYGTASTVLAVISAVCIRFGGETYDRTGSYDVMFVTFAGLASVAAGLMFATASFSGRPVPEGAP